MYHQIMSGHNTTNKDETNHQLVEYRLDRLEEAVASLTVIKDCVMKWDSKFSSNESFLQCPVHMAKVGNMEKRVERLEGIVEDLDRFKWKAVGVLSIVILIVQIFGTAVVENLVKHPAAAAVVHPTQPHLSTNSVVTNAVPKTK